MGSPVLVINDLRTSFFTDSGIVNAVDGVNLSINQRETVGIVGESGCGKSVTALSVMRLIPYPPGKIVSGEIRLEDEDLIPKSEADMRRVRGNDVAMIFQEPMTSLNPVFTVGDQVMESIRLHQHLGRKDARTRAVEMLRLVGIPSPEKRVDEFPHQMSGGMRQRVMIAMALSCNPKLLIADEPTTALDVTIQAQILDLMMNLQEELGTSIMMITHDLGVVAEIADRVVVMYAGQIIESGDVESVFNAPAHPYTQGLLGSLPKLDEEQEYLHVIRGVVPSPFSMPAGCRFQPRCDCSGTSCTTQQPPTVQIGQDHVVSCWKHTNSSFS